MNCRQSILARLGNAPGCPNFNDLRRQCGFIFANRKSLGLAVRFKAGHPGRSSEKWLSLQNSVVCWNGEERSTSCDTWPHDVEKAWVRALPPDGELPSYAQWRPEYVAQEMQDVQNQLFGHSQPDRHLPGVPTLHSASEEAGMNKTVIALLLSTAICVPGAFGHQQESAAENQPTTTGKFVFDVEITISSPGISRGLVSCQASVELVSYSSGLPYAEDDAAVRATLKGSTGSCSIPVPYDWQVRSSQDYVTLKVTLTAGPSSGLPSNLHLYSCNACAGVAGLPARISEKDVGGRMLVPLGGATTTESLAFTL